MNRNQLQRRRSSRFIPLLLIACFLSFSVVDASRCARRAANVECGSFSGILYSINNQWPLKKVANATHWTPLDVPDNGTLSISVCNFGNYRMHNATIQNVSIVPTLVGSVGRHTDVRVQVYNSANLDVSGGLLIGYRMPVIFGNQTVPKNKTYGGNDTSVVSKIVMGPVLDGASISVDISKSANVRLRSGTEHLWIGKATLFNEIINAAHDSPTHCYMDACYEVHMSDSANVKADQVNGPNVYIQDGQLDDEAVDTACVGKGSFVRVQKQNVSNVRDVGYLHIWDGELSDEAVDALHVRDARVEVLVKDSGNVHARNVSINEGELIDELVDARDVKDAEISVIVLNSGNVYAKALDIFEGELIDESVDIRNAVRSSIVITLKNSGNVRVEEVLSILEGELVDEVFDANVTLAGYLDISVINSSNVLCGPGIVKLNRSELLESVIDVGNMTDMRAALSVSDSANVHVPAESIHMIDAVLAAKSVDVDVLKSGLKLRVTRSMGNGCASCMEYDPGCVFEQLDDDELEDHYDDMAEMAEASAEASPEAIPTPELE